MQIFRAAILLAIASFVVQAGLVQWFHWHPPGLWQFTAPLLSAGYVVVLAAFLCRRPWSWLVVAFIAPLTVIFNLAFWPTAEYYGESVAFAWGVFAVQTVSCAAIAVVMLLPSTKKWFRDARAG
jgi:hypothetical protein